MHFLGYSACDSQSQVSAGQQSKFYNEFRTCAERMAGLLAREQYIPPAGHAPML